MGLCRTGTIELASINVKCQGRSVAWDILAVVACDLGPSFYGLRRGAVARRDATRDFSSITASEWHVRDTVVYTK